jgi:hypothetical protein
VLRFLAIHIAALPAPARILSFLITLLGLWLPLAAPLYWLLKSSKLSEILVIALLCGLFIGLIHQWGKRIYGHPALLKHYGLEISQRNGREVLIGFGMSLALIFGLFLLEGALGWLVWQPPAVVFPWVVITGVQLAITFGFIEELLFRGWLLDELQRDYSPQVSLWVNSLLFAILHFLRPLSVILRTWVMFPGLVLLGLTLVWAKRSTQGRLGFAIGIHAGLICGNYSINTGKLINYTQQVPDWMTGIDQNPLASMMGLFFLSILALITRRLSLLRVKRA